MKIPALMVCKGFIQRGPAGLQEGLISLLPPKSRAIYYQLPPPGPFKSEHLRWDLLEHIHFSWLSPYLRTLSEGDIRLFLAALDTQQANGLKDILGLKDDFPELSKVGKKALRNILTETIVQNQTLVPLAFLPEHPLNTLLDKNHRDFMQLIRMLGLHDLSTEVRQIISTAELKKIFSSLTKKEGEYLNQIMLHKEPLIFQRLFLQKWDGSKEQLHKLLEERGVHRLGHALWNGSDSLVWYLTRKLDMHLGNLLMKYREKPTHERSEKILREQIEKILGRLEGGS